MELTEPPKEDKLTKPYWKTYYANNKEKVVNRNKAYREKNHEKIREEYKQYWLNNKDKIKERRKEIVECPLCNVKVTRESFCRHKSSKLHKSKELNENIEEIKSNENV